MNAPARPSAAPSTSPVTSPIRPTPRPAWRRVLAVGLAAVAMAAACSGPGGSDDEAAVGVDAPSPTAGDQGDESSSLQATVRPDSSAAGSGDDDGDDASTTTPTTAPLNPGFCDGAAPTDIRFRAGDTSAAIDQTAVADQRDLYHLEVQDDQILSIDLTSVDPTASVTVAGPGGGPTSDPLTTEIIAPTTAGIYQICIAGGSGGDAYQLTVGVIDDATPTRVDAPWCGVTVNDRGAISFTAGGFATVVNGAVVAAERNLHTIEARADQDIDLLLISPADTARFALRSPSGDILIDGVSDFRIPLPEDGVYQLCVGSEAGNTDYVLDIAIA